MRFISITARNVANLQERLMLNNAGIAIMIGIEHLTGAIFGSRVLHLISLAAYSRQMEGSACGDGVVK